MLGGFLGETAHFVHACGEDIDILGYLKYLGSLMQKILRSQQEDLQRTG